MAWNQMYSTKLGGQPNMFTPMKFANNSIANNADAPAPAVNPAPATPAAAPVATASPPAQTVQQGVVPMTVEPLHQWEKSGLAALAGLGNNGAQLTGTAIQKLQELLTNPQTAATTYIDPNATKYTGQAAEAMQAGRAPVTLDEVLGIANPFAEALKTRLNESGAAARAAITANQGMRGGRSFGDISTGMRLGSLDKEMLSKSGDIDFQTFEQALAQINAARGRDITVGSGLGSLAGLTQDIFTSGLSGAGTAASKLYGTGREGIQDQITAGTAIRDYNQGINDQIGNNIIASQNDEAQKIQDALRLIEQMTGNVQYQTPQNSLTKAGGIASVAGGLLGKLSGASTSDNAATGENISWSF